VRLRDPVRAGRVAWFSFLWNDLTLTGQAALKSFTNFLTGCLLERIGAPGEERREEKGDEEERPGLHPLILETKP